MREWGSKESAVLRGNLALGSQSAAAQGTGLVLHGKTLWVPVWLAEGLGKLARREGMFEKPTQGSGGDFVTSATEDPGPEMTDDFLLRSALIRMPVCRDKYFVL